MNVDKFGHHVHKRLRLTEYFEKYNDALHKSEEGYFDLKSTKLRGLPVPTYKDEAVSKQYVDKSLEGFCNRKDFETRLRSEIKSQLKHFKEELYKALTASYYTKPEIDAKLREFGKGSKDE